MLGLRLCTTTSDSVCFPDVDIYLDGIEYLLSELQSLKMIKTCTNISIVIALKNRVLRMTKPSKSSLEMIQAVVSF